MNDIGVAVQLWRLALQQFRVTAELEKQSENT
jgi:hypothetical protein